MSGADETLSLWVGPQSQALAHHFYSLQAEQFFEEGEDPTNQHALWTFKDKELREKHPRMLVFDTESHHLTQLRRVNLDKMIKKIQQPTKEQMYFNFQFMPKEQEEAEDPEAYLYENWQCSEDNYVLIDKKFYVERLGFDQWESLYQSSQDAYEDRVRKQLERSDSLRVLMVCSDAQLLGFAHKLIEHLNDQCPKKAIVLCSLSDPQTDTYFHSSFLPLLGSVAQNVDIVVDFDQQQEKFEYFEKSDFFSKISPVLNSLMTPFVLKDSNSAEFIQRIDVGNRPLFSMAYTLPIISEQSKLHTATNIFEYLPSPGQEKKPTYKQTDKGEDETVENRINWVNSSYLNITNPPKPEKKYNELYGQEKVECSSSKLLSESFVIKGQFQHLQKHWSPRVAKCSLKYLQGILSVNPSHQLKYSPFYLQDYGQKVLQYPFHTVLYQHSAFGPSIRNFIRRHQSHKMQHELVSEWKENTIALADLYGEQAAQDSD